MEAAKLVGIKMPHGASSQWKGEYWDAKGEIAGMPLDKICFVYNDMPDADPMGHVGIYLGDGYVVDSRGHAYGVKHSPLTSYAWDHYGLLKGLGNEEVNVVNYLAIGSKGDAVKTLQAQLNAAGFDCGAIDGIFGSKTDAAVKALQKVRLLPETGIVDEATQNTLEKEPAAPDTDVKNLAQTVYEAIKKYLG
jgi:hypothetical protein